MHRLARGFSVWSSVFVLLLVGDLLFGQAPAKRQYGPSRPPSSASSPRTSDARNTSPQRALSSPNRQRAGNLPVATRPVGPPKEFQLTPEQKDRIAKMLDFWEQRTSKITTFRADFVRWTYDPVMGPKDGKAAFISGGEIRFAAPDRGMIKETKIAQYDVEKARNGEKWPYTEKKDAIGEHWVCDGKSIYEFQHEGKKLIETRLPPEMQGKAISQGPLPFMFGAKAATIQERYYIREIPRIKGDDPYHLELLPKGSGADFSRVRIRLDAKEFLPDVLEVYALNGVGKSTYQFNNRTINSVSDNVKNFWDSFVSPKPPRGWEKTTRNVGRPVVSKQARTPAAFQR